MNTKLFSLLFIALISGDAIIKAQETYSGEATYSEVLKTGETMQI